MGHFWQALFLQLILRLLLCPARLANAVSYPNDFHITWGEPNNVKLLDNDQVLELILDNVSASAFASSNKFLFGSIGMQIKLVQGNSAGTVSAYYFSSQTANHDELDFEFLGNVTDQPYILQTNVFANGTGGREQRIYLWFDPSADYHNYSVLWNDQHVVFAVDGIPIREFANNEASGLPYLNSQPMGIFCSLWDGDNWATEGGRVKINWTAAPFISSYSSYSIDACVDNGGSPANCSGAWWNQNEYQTLSDEEQGQLSWVEQNFMVYNYCTDTKRYPQPPPECPPP